MAQRTSPAAKRPRAPKKPAPKILSFAEIEAADDRPLETVEIPEWGGAVKIRALSKGQAQDAFAAALDDDGFDARKWADELLVACLVEPAVERDQLAVIRDKSNAAVERIHKKVLDINGLSAEAVEGLLRTFLPG